ncbi:MAG TPA: CapA family protein [Solirubrobacteraceae bacterium]|jgi:poly-gamma-glutamate synthesis protein (capsule biosynthesis protein)
MTSAQPTTGRSRAADRAGLIRLALAGDTMLGRGVAERLRENPRTPLIAPEVAEAAASADRFVLNLECCISDRGERFADPRKPFFFRAPPIAAQRLAELGVDAVTLANNHALDYGPVALLDTLEHLDAAGIAHVGAGADVAAARAPVILDGLRIVAAGDHPGAFAATAGRPGIAYADLRGRGAPAWLLDAARPGPDAATVLVTPHWGPNMRPEPLPTVRKAAAALVAAGATLVAGHSAHVFQGVAGRVLYDLGDFLDDYAVDSGLRNDLGLLWLVDVDRGGPRRIEALPLKLDFCHTRLATGDDAAWIRRCFTRHCARLGTEVREDDGRLVIAYAPDARATEAT